MPGTQFCHSCGKQLKLGDKFCQYCGAKTGDKFCRMCGANLKGEERFCGYCGAKVLLIRRAVKSGTVTIEHVRPVVVKPEVVKPEFAFADPDQEIALLPEEHLLFPPKTIKIKFHKGYIRKYFLDPIIGLVLWGVSAVLIFLILDDGLNFIQYGTGEFAEWWTDPNRPQHLFDWPSVFWFIGIGVLMFVIGWLWSLVNLVRGPPKVDLFATNQRLIFRDEERTGFLTRAILGVNIFLVLRNPFYIKKSLQTYRNLKHQLEASRDEMEYEYLILTKDGCIKNVHLQKISFFIPAFVLLVAMILSPFLFTFLGIPFFILFILSLIFRLFKHARPRIRFQKGHCQGQLRYFVESEELDLIGLMPDQETVIMQTYSS
ncbi:MAG: zinc ribbon domain-containing protein [Candidatus Heimdallarchaeota archaeon]